MRGIFTACLLIGLFITSGTAARAQCSFELLAQTGGPARAVAVDGELAYFAAGSTVKVMDLSDPADPQVLGSVLLPLPAWRIAAHGDRGLVTFPSAQFGVRFLDLSNPSDPQVRGSYVAPAEAFSAQIVGSLAYITYRGVGLRILDISDLSQPTLVGQLPLPGECGDIEVVGTTAYVCNVNHGLRIIDVADPATPVLLGTYSAGGSATEVRLRGTVAFVLDAFNGIRAVDVSNPQLPVMLSSAWPTGLSLSIVGNTAVIAQFDRLYTVNITNPAAIVYVEQFWIGHAYDILDTATFGDHVLAAVDDNGLEVWNATNPAAVTRTGQFLSRPIQATDIALDPQRRLAFVADPQHGLLIFDVQAPRTPRLVGSFLPTVSGPRTYGLSLAGATVYLTNIGTFGFSGYHRVSVADPAAPIELSRHNLNPFMYPFDVAVLGDDLYIVDLSSTPADLARYDITDPAAPVLLNSYPLGATTVGSLRIVTTPDHLHLADSAAGWWFYDPASDEPPALLSSTLTNGIGLEGTRAYLAQLSDGVAIYDITTPTQPVALGGLATGLFAVDVAPDGAYAYVAEEYFGVSALAVADPADVRVLTRTPLDGHARQLNLTDGVLYVVNQDGGLLLLGPPQPTDLNRDLQTDLADLATLLANFGSDDATPADGDIDYDRQVDLNDLAVLLVDFGSRCD